MKDKCKCPVCGKEYNGILRHIRIHIPDIRNKEDFYKKFPDYEGPILIDKREKKECFCDICGKKYDYNNSLYLHYKLYHPDYYKQLKLKENKNTAIFVCPICNKNFTDIKQHIEAKHRIEWNEFCNLYNWENSKTKYVSSEYRKKLSINKINFYRYTERGKELRKLNSEIWKTDKNPSKLKLSKEKSMYSRAKNNKWIPEYNYRGIKVTYKNITFRSFTEFQFYILCLHFNIPIIYEPHDYIVKYYNNEKDFMTTYLPDFLVNNKFLIEIKSSKRDVRIANTLRKYIEISKIYNDKNILFEICTPEIALKKLGIECNKYEIKDIIRKYVKEALQNNNICFLCESCSRIVKYYTELNDLSNNKNIILI